MSVPQFLAFLAGAVAIIAGCLWIVIRGENE